MPVTTTQKVPKAGFGDLAGHPERHPGCFGLGKLKRSAKTPRA